MDAGLLPVKRLTYAKQRLAPAYDEAARERIAHALLADALCLCTSVKSLCWWVITDDPVVSHAATEQGLKVVPDPGAGLNAGVHAGIRTAMEAGANSITIIPADVPLARPSDIQLLLHAGRSADIVVVPSHSDGGTNALFSRPPDLIEPLFGPDSFRRHLDAADLMQARCTILSVPRLEVDLDTPEDIGKILTFPIEDAFHTRSSIYASDQAGGL